MTGRFGRATWSLEVPVGWRAWHDDGCATLVGPDEIGALQISAAFKDSEVLDEDLQGFASDRLVAGAKPTAVRIGDFVGLELAFRDGDLFWRQWFLRNAAQVLFVTYNCYHQDRGLEDGPVHEALESLVARGVDGR